jgi:2-C-methyl-D-erythritol 2,4-cyclodiphosphate synthase
MMNAGVPRIGNGFDVHALVVGRRLVLGGVSVPFDRGLEGHSDADVLLHAICNAILGAIGEGDIGRHFPDMDAAYKNVDSRVLLRRVWQRASGAGYVLGNVDATVIAQAPRLAPYVPQMVANIASDLDAATAQVNVKATTTEHLGFAGRGEGIAAMASVLLVKPER